MTTTLGSTFPTAKRMVHRVHGSTACMRSSTEPAFATGFSQVDVHVIGITDLANGGPALGTDTANFTGRQG